MCSYSQVIEDRGMERGIERGILIYRTLLETKSIQQTVAKTTESADKVKKIAEKYQAIKTSDKKQVNKTDKNMEKIRQYLQEQDVAKTRDIAELLGLSVARTRAILSEMDDVEAHGTNRNRTYRLNM